MEHAVGFDAVEEAVEVDTMLFGSWFETAECFEMEEYEGGEQSFSSSELSDCGRMPR